ncbi:MAG: MFS transporter [Propionibacteriaceae bacterium]|jgi:MHS family proline/betaine transporter-like MFS transporter|nr:MFS transporter [Propionibacteriaceae bacterium]
MSNIEPTDAEVASPVPKKMSTGYVIAGISGNILEWFDFGIYSYFAVAIAANFFPKNDDPIVALMNTFMVFGLGFLARPIGGFLFGHFGDRIGRKNTLSITVVLMGVSTFAIGCLPSYSQVGVASTMILVVLRVCQGISAGGEWGNVISFLGEFSKPGNRGFIVSFSQVGSAVGLLIGSLLGLLLSTTMAPEDLNGWGWRVPFLLGIAIAVFGWFMRRSVDETPVFKEKQENQELVAIPMVEAFRSHWKTMIAVFLVTAGGFTAYWLILSYMPTYFQTFLDTSPQDAYLLSSLTLVGYGIILPISGILADKYGRKPIMLIGAIGIIVLSYPIVSVLASTNILGLRILMVMMLAMIYGLMNSAFTSAMPESFPAKVRVSGVSIPYNLGSALFGGTCSYVATWLISSNDNNPMMLPIYIIIMMCVSLLSLIFLIKETVHKDYSA